MEEYHPLSEGIEKDAVALVGHDEGCGEPLAELEEIRMAGQRAGRRRRPGTG